MRFAEALDGDQVSNVRLLSRIKGEGELRALAADARKGGCPFATGYVTMALLLRLLREVE